MISPGIIFLNRFYWPEEPATAQLLTDLAEALAARGHKITVITSRPKALGIARRETHRNVQIIRVAGSRWGQHHLIGRAIDFITFLLGSSWQLLRIADRGDKIVAMTDPPTLGLVMWPIARLKGASISHWVQDVYPEIAAALSSHRILRGFATMLQPLRNFVWGHSDGCIALGKDMAAYLARIGVSSNKISIIPNWSPVGLDPAPSSAVDALRSAWKLEGKFIVMYSGNLGRVHDLEPVLEVAARLKAHSEIAFVIVGNGAQRAKLMQAAVMQKLANLHFHPAQPRTRLAETLALGDVHLITLLAGCEALVFPSKLYGIAAIGRPTIVIASRECELAKIVASHGFGAAFTRDESGAIADYLCRLATDVVECNRLSTAAAEFSRTQGRLAHAVMAWETLLAREATC